jgi:hypothetical protein|tara:strand:- start:6605 stop:6778 length:174 start_codon:yes stop_codon:yes gene_type:complete
MPKKKTTAEKEMEAKLAARKAAKVRPEEPQADERIYLNMPKKKKVAKKKTKKKTKSK